ncbi:MAG: hypothetical protein ACI4G0_03770 [Ruminococcus sp.]
MKECPICHAMNGDGSETCYNCHASLDFKIYNAYQNDREKQKDYAVDKNTVIKYFDLICTNECQDNLELLNSKGFSNENLSLQIKIIDNSNDTVITVFADELKIGYIPKDKIHFFKICDAMFDAAELFIYSKDSILSARISVVFQRISDSIADEYVENNNTQKFNSWLIKHKVRCKHCNKILTYNDLDSSYSIDKNGNVKPGKPLLCSKCKTHKFIVICISVITAIHIALFLIGKITYFFIINDPFYSYFLFYILLILGTPILLIFLAVKIPFLYYDYKKNK